MCLHGKFTCKPIISDFRFVCGRIMWCIRVRSWREHSQLTSIRIYLFYHLLYVWLSNNLLCLTQTMAQKARVLEYIFLTARLILQNHFDRMMMMFKCFAVICLSLFVLKHISRICGHKGTRHMHCVGGHIFRVENIFVDLSRTLCVFFFLPTLSIGSERCLNFWRSESRCLPLCIGPTGKIYSFIRLTSRAH